MRWQGSMAAVRPMLAVLASPRDVPLTSERLVYEPKYDGIRALVALEPGPARPRPGAARPRPVSVTIRSRSGNDKTAQFPDLVEDFQRVAARLTRPMLLDGEIVAVDRRGRPTSFTHLQSRIHVTGRAAVAAARRARVVAFYAFDLLRDGDDDLRRRPLSERRIRLQEAFRPPVRSRLHLSEMAVGDGRRLFRRAERHGWEGLVVKDAGSIYESGRRSPSWRKLKIVQQQEFVVGGWTEPRQSRAHFGALLLGLFAGSRLRFMGSVGSGFNETELARVAARLKPLASRVSPFAGHVAALGTPHWARPELVVTVKYAEITPEGHLRHPVYLGLREDKPSADVTDGRPRRGPQAAARTAVRKDLRSVIARLHELEDARRDGVVDVPGGGRLRVTNLWKVFWPESGITKGDLLRYYAEVAPLILPVVADRPLVMKRFPNGIEGLTFYQQRVLEKTPAGVRIEALPAGLDPIKDDEEATNPARFVGGDLMTLLYMAQVAAISQDPWFSTVRTPREPDQVAIDLDPGTGTGFETVLDVARWVRDELDRLHIPSAPKTSGSRGLHIYVPLPPATSYETGQLLCQVIATLVSSKHRRQATIERMVAKRPRGTVYLDCLQNILGKTLACAYSVRASAFAGVSTPLTWEEVDAAVDPRDFTIRTAPSRFHEAGDLWATLRTGRPVDIEAVVRKGT